MVDVVYVATSANDGRFARICIASIRAVYPDIPIRLLIGGAVSRARIRELADVWGARPAPYVPSGDYGWGFVKLEPLFGPPGERFLVLDSDTALLGPALNDLPDAPFVVDCEEQTEAEIRRLYYDVDVVRLIDPSAEAPAFVFNSGQWIGTSGILGRADFDPWVRWDMPRTLRHSNAFMPGDQGILNYVLNRKAIQENLAVAQHPLMRWPGHDLSDIDINEVVKGYDSPYSQICHWAGFKGARVAALPRPDLLTHFERLHYAAQGSGESLRLARATVDMVAFTVRRAAMHIRRGATARLSRLRSVSIS